MYLESFLVFRGLLFCLLAFEVLSSISLLRSSRNDALSKESGITTHLELFLVFASLLFFLLAFEFYSLRFLL